MKRKTNAHFNLIHHESGYKADIYPYTGNPLHGWAIKNLKRIPIDSDQIISVAPPEYVIIRKLQYFREGGSDKHLSDIRKMLSTCELQLKEKVLLDWIRNYSLEKEWSLIKEQIE